MKEIRKVWIVAAALVFVVWPVSGRAQDAAGPAATENAPAKNIQMVAARASLEKGIDAKKAKQGDAVTAKLDEAVKIPDSMELPRNTVLIGRIDQVQPSENKSDSSIEVTFDKAQLKTGQQLAIKVTIVQIVPPTIETRNQEGGAGAPTMPSSPTPSSPGGTGGGMQPPQPTHTPEPTMSAGIPDGSQQSGQQPGYGVQLQSDIHQSNSGTFTAKKKNVHLDNGTQLQLAIAVIPPNTQVQ